MFCNFLFSQLSGTEAHSENINNKQKKTPLYKENYGPEQNPLGMLQNFDK